MTMSNGPLLHYHPSEEHQQTFTSQAHPLNHEGGNTPPSTRPDVCFNNSNNYTTFFHDHHTSHSTLMTSLQETDEDEVKRPMNSFLLWAKIMRKQYASKNPNMHNAEISKLLGKIWNSMTTKDKRPYVEQAERLRVVHMRTYPNYRYAPKRRKERRNHRMISPEVAAALHNTLFDVNNIINEQISQTDVLSQNLKSYGYLRSAFQQNRNKNIGNVSDSHSDSSFSRCNTASPLPCSEQSFSSASSCEYQLQLPAENQIATEPAKNHTESMTLHYRPVTNTNCAATTFTQQSQTQTVDYFSSSSSESNDSGAEDDTNSSIEDEFSNYLKHITSSRNTASGLVENDDDSFFWNDITDIITSGSL
eukprot:TCONS_00064745-protein